MSLYFYIPENAKSMLEKFSKDPNFPEMQDPCKPYKEFFKNPTGWKKAVISVKNLQMQLTEEMMRNSKPVPADRVKKYEKLKYRLRKTFPK